MKLHENHKDFQGLIQATAEKFNMREVFIEKDYWVVYVLKNLAKSNFSQNVVFKGGTSLSKAHKLIKRFSEDIDLVLLDKAKMSGGQVKKLLREIERALIKPPIEIDEEYKPSKGSKFRKTGYKYPKQVERNDFGHGTKTLILELNAFANPSPVTQLPVDTYIAEFLRNENPELIEEYELEEIQVLVLDIKRTFVEKLMGLIRLSISAGPDYHSLRKKVRHFYDVSKLIERKEVQEFISTVEFDECISHVLEDDLVNPEFQEGWKPLNGMNLSEAELFVKTDEICRSIAPVLEGDFQSLLYGEESISMTEVKSALLDIKKVLPRVVV